MRDILPNPRLIILDWSGTISNDRQLTYETNQRLLEAYGWRPLTLKEWRAGCEGWNAGNFLAKRLIKPAPALYEEFAQLLAVTKAELGEPQPYTGAVEAVRALCVGRLSKIVSSHPQGHLEHEARSYGIDQLVQDQDIYGGVIDKVPVIQHVVKDAGVSLRSALYVGDTVQDIHAARQAGVRIAAVTHGYQSERLLRSAGPDMVVASLGRLVSRLQQG